METITFLMKLHNQTEPNNPQTYIPNFFTAMHEYEKWKMG